MITILVVDDDELILSSVSKSLESRGTYRVVTASGGKAGLKAARKKKPDLILLDINMPDLDGLSVLKEIRRNKKTRHIPVIMLTAVDDQDAKEQASYEYAEQYVTKPFKMEELEPVIERVLARPRHF